MPPPLRHRDPGHRLPGQYGPSHPLQDYYDIFYVDCPRCAGVAVSEQNGVSCSNCAFHEKAMWLGPTVIWMERQHCSRCFKVLPKKELKIRNWQERPTKLAVVCRGCGLENPAQAFMERDGSFEIDPFFGLPLALKINMPGGILVAYNAAHAKALHDFIAADLRERGDVPMGKTLLTILPAWIKSAKNRKVVARGYQRLYERGLALEGNSEAV